MFDFNNITFENPQWFWLFLFFPILIAWYIWKRNLQTPEVKISSIKGFKVKQSLLPRLRPLLFVLRLICLALLITGMARPRTVDVTSKTKKTQGIDIIMAIDVSPSMLARDLKPNRLEALKSVASEFIDGRPNDRIGLVVYAGESFTKTPITSDKAIVQSALRDINYSDLLDNGTAIGMGLATSVNRLKDSKAKSKVIILLSDGVNNSGFIDPKIATELAVEYDIKVYTIGLGSNGTAMGPIGIDASGQLRYGPTKVEIDEELMTQIAEQTKGQYFRATNNEKLEAIYEEINKLEKTEVEESKYYNYEEKYRPLVILAGLLFLVEIILRNTVFRSFV
ncbi:Ca-activated chloride channel family protein [Mesonia phycicola]|uniref:Ca-activated chloride channel family protein n=1 Tax=Mesonia phycicola TaxID=579105 RepID=A0A1M6CUL3_9FLAO|nr:VWA domain-containing protein [Mesonia phycicola]SHI64650.1 Ca-activated chloride channel family protein [Mesonia phycicola]